MADQGAPNMTNKQGHDETNKVVGEGPANTSQTRATSGGAAELSRLDADPDASPGGEAEPERGGPSMATRAADPGRKGPEESSFAPGGDKVSQPGVEEEDLRETSGGRDETPRQYHERQPR